jgi:hypothetical protein
MTTKLVIAFLLVAAPIVVYYALQWFAPICDRCHRRFKKGDTKWKCEDDDIVCMNCCAQENMRTIATSCKVTTRELK